MVRYVEVEDFKASVSLSGYTFADADAEVCLDAASRAVEKATNRRRFDKDTSPVAKVFTARSSCLVPIGDIVQVNSVKVSGTTVTGYVAEPLNAVSEGRPYTMLTSDTPLFSTSNRGAIEVTGLWGWPEVPAEVKRMTTILAARLLKRSREAAFGVVTTGGLEGVAVRLATTDPEMSTLIGPLKRQLVGWR